MNSASMPARKTGSTVGYYAAFICLGLVSASLGPTLPGLAEHTRSTLSAISFVFTSRSFGYLLGAARGGRLYDRLPGHALMAAALLITAVTVAISPLLAIPALLLAAWFIIGLAEGSIDAGGNTLLIWVHKADVGPYMQALHFFFGVGSFISPLIVGRVIEATGDINWAYWIVAAILIPAAIWVARLPSPTPIADGDEESNGKGTDYTLVALIALSLFTFVGAEASYGGWIYTYATAMGLAGAASGAYLTSAFWGALTVGRLLSIPLSLRLQARTMLVIDAIGCLVSVAVVLMWPTSLAAIWVGTIGMGLAMASVFAVVFTVAERHMHVTGAITGWFFVGASSGSMIVPLIIGQLFERVGPQSTMVVILLDLLLALGIYVALARHIHKREGEG